MFGFVVDREDAAAVLQELALESLLALLVERAAELEPETGEAEKLAA